MKRSDSSKGERKWKKVEFALETQPSSNNISGTQAAWDSETDHLLSYFLGGDSQPSPVIPEDSVNTSEIGSFDPLPHPNATITATAAAEENEDDDDPEPPPTPAPPQFASRSSKAKAGDSSNRSNNNPSKTATKEVPQPSSSLASSNSSSSSSLSAMTATLVSGGPLLYQQMQQQQQHMYASMMAAAAAAANVPPSPISPAAMIGSGSPENLLLPPAGANARAHHPFPPGFPAPPPPPHHPAASPYSHPVNSPAAMEQHIAWLRSINAMAKAAASATGAAAVAVGGGPPHPPAHAVPAIPLAPGATMPPPTTMPPPPPFPAAAIPALGTTTQQPQPPPPFAMPYPAYPHLAFYGHAAAAAAAAMQQQNKPPPEESEEKRAKRLERNRESARKSRRRKKERLQTVEAQVNQMHQRVAQERTRQIGLLVPGLRQQRMRNIQQMQDVGKTPDAAQLMTLVRETGPNSPIFQAVLEFQSYTLRQMLLPRHQKLWLWLVLQKESFFVVGKEEYGRREPEKLAARTSSVKVSSKQIGDELTNGPNATEGPPVPIVRGEESDSKPGRTAYASDGSRMWPLMCYEHQLSVDQEDKVLALHKKLNQRSDFSERWEKSISAVKAAISLRDALDSVCRIASQREERTLVGVLTLDQIIKYKQWLVMNHERSFRSLRQRDEMQSASSLPHESLQEICTRLNSVLKISKVDRI